MTPFDKTALTIGCALIPLSASAAEAVTQLEAVTVTAKGYASDTLETPHALTVIGVDAIAASGTANPGALLRGQAGLAVASDGAWGENPVIRGLKKEHIVVMVDGVRVNSAQPQGAIASLADAGLLERAEVVKGPVSVLYGSGAMGGVVELHHAPTALHRQGRGARRSFRRPAKRQRRQGSGRRLGAFRPRPRPESRLGHARLRRL